MNDLHWLTAGEIGAAYAKRSLSPVELTRALIERIDRLDPRVNVFTSIDRDRAMGEARAAEVEITAGRRRSPLHGVPIAPKDLMDAVGFPTTCHSRILLDNHPKQDADVIGRLRRAGAIVLGKVATWEFACGGVSFDLPFPPARNPWNLEHSPGGSSSGSGAGLSAGLFPLSIGTDTGGSIRHPSAACGIVGMKPTYDLVSRIGVFPYSYTMDHVGPMGRSVADIALLLDQIAGAGHAPGGYGAELVSGVQRVRIGFARNFHTDEPGDSEVVAGLENAARIFAEEGAQVSDVTLPPRKDFEASHKVIELSEAWSVHAQWLQTKPGEYGKGSRYRLMTGAFFTAGEFVDAQRRRGQLIAAVEEQLRKVDVLLVVNAFDPAPRLDSKDRIRQARLPFNLTGHPALALMSGMSRTGLPLSMQLVGRYFDEVTLLRVAAAFERATPFHDMHPRLEA